MERELLHGLSPGDPNSYSRPENAKTTHLHLCLDVDFQRKLLSGIVELTVEVLIPGTSHVILDTKELTILEVTDKATNQPLRYEVGEAVKSFGAPLTITLPETVNNKCVINVTFHCSSDSTALQWLSPDQTLGKHHPYMFCHCEAIHCRAMIPCQDTPSVKASYTAEVTIPEDLVVLMSGQRIGEPQGCGNGRKKFRFDQPVPIPSYLIAIVVGALESRKIGPRSHVWSERDVVDKAAYEFAETEKMLQTAEQLCGPYVWGIYDVLVLPPSFPFGGMENPCLTFVTPTLLAGDRSLADVVAHEIAHSWTGNLVTNRNFEHFWLNEGFTVFVERKIVGRLRGEKHRHFSAIGGWKELKYTIDTRGGSDPLTCLTPRLTGVDPDDAFSTVPYEKGHALLWRLEEAVGGPDAFEPFLRAYIDKYKYKSIDTHDFRSFLDAYFAAQNKTGALAAIDWDSWLNKPGMPPSKPVYDTSLADACAALSKKWSSWGDTSHCPFTAGDLSDFSSVQKREFLAQLLEEPPLSISKLEVMDQLYQMSAIINSEIRFRWLRLCLRARWQKIVDSALSFATEQGRMKFVRPIFRDLYAWEEMRQRAIDVYQRHKASMMHVTAYTIAKDLHLTS